MHAAGALFTFHDSHQAHKFIYKFQSDNSIIWSTNWSPHFLLISNLIDKLHLHQVLGTKITETNKSQKTDANEAY